MSIALFNGEFLPLEEVRISPLDRGFLFGDSVYEVIPSYAGRFFLLDAHLDRLARSLAAIRLPNPFGREQWERHLGDLLRHNGAEPTDGSTPPDLGLYLQVTRGVAPRDHAFPDVSEPTVLGMVSPIRPLGPAVREAGVSAVTRTDERWSRCDIKATTLLANVLARQEAVESDAVEALLLRNGRLTEGAASNAFVVRDGTLVTPPLDSGMLAGVTRDFVLGLARGEGVPVEERGVTAAELRAADEVWLSSSTRELLPVTRIDGELVGTGRPGPLWARLHAAYQAAKPGAAHRQSEALNHE